MKICEKCRSEFTPKYPSLSVQRFCSRSCAAKVNNSKSKKRERTKCCKECGELILSKNTYCQTCISKGMHLGGGTFLVNRTIGEVLYEIGSNKYGVIRCHARSVVKSRPQICHNCKYDRHVEVCHIKDICEFSLETKIGIVNDSNNLILLCPNCHWEFDNELLKIMVGEEGIEPPTLAL